MQMGSRTAVWRSGLLICAVVPIVAGAGPTSAAGGCRDHKGQVHAEGARVVQPVVSGINTLTVVDVWYVCRGGRWVNETTGRQFGK
jgi:hypothetical protein